MTFFQSYGCTIDYGGQASNEFPVLLKFENNWVVHDFLRIYLKNSAQKAKKVQQNKDRELAAAAKGKRRGVCTPQSSHVMMLSVLDQPIDLLAHLISLHHACNQSTRYMLLPGHQSDR